MNICEFAATVEFTDPRGAPLERFTQAVVAQNTEQAVQCGQELGNLIRNDDSVKKIVLQHFHWETANALSEDMEWNGQWLSPNILEHAHPDSFAWLLAHIQHPHLFAVSCQNSLKGHKQGSARLCNNLALMQLEWIKTASPDAIFEHILRNVDNDCYQGFDLRGANEHKLFQSFTVDMWKKRIDNCAPTFLFFETPTNFNDLCVFVRCVPNFGQAMQDAFDTTGSLHQQIFALLEGDTLENTKIIEHIDPEKYQEFLCEAQNFIAGLRIEYKKLLGVTAMDLMRSECRNFPYKKYLNESSKDLHELFRVHRPSNQSFIHHLVADYPHFLARNVACEPQVLEALNDPYTRDRFLRHTETLKEVFEDMPSLLQWRDNKGNTLGHWLVIDNYVNQDVIETLLAFPPLRTANNMGVSVRDVLIAQDELEDETLALYDKHILQEQVGGLGQRGTQRKM